MIPAHFLCLFCILLPNILRPSISLFTFLSYFKMRTTNILPMFLPSLFPLPLILSLLLFLHSLLRFCSRGLSLKCSIFYFFPVVYLSLFHFILLCDIFPPLLLSCTSQDNIHWAKDFIFCIYGIIAVFSSTVLYWSIWKGKASENAEHQFS